MKRSTCIAGIIMIIMLSIGISSCEKKQGAAGTGTSPSAQTGAGSESAGAGSQMGSAQGKVDINTASSQELQGVPGIDQTLAQNIVSYRDANGPFASVDDLIKVQGMDKQKLDSVRSSLTISQSGMGAGGASTGSGSGSSDTTGGMGSGGTGTGNGSSGTDTSGGSGSGGMNGTSGSGSGSGSSGF